MSSVAETDSVFASKESGLTTVPSEKRDREAEIMQVPYLHNITNTLAVFTRHVQMLVVRVG